MSLLQLVDEEDAARPLERGEQRRRRRCPLYPGGEPSTRVSWIASVSSPQSSLKTRRALESERPQGCGKRLDGRRLADARSGRSGAPTRAAPGGASSAARRSRSRHARAPASWPWIARASSSASLAAVRSGFAATGRSSRSSALWCVLPRRDVLQDALLPGRVRRRVRPRPAHLPPHGPGDRLGCGGHDPERRCERAGPEPVQLVAGSRTRRCRSRTAASAGTPPRGIPRGGRARSWRRCDRARG